jgi:hypothetical protein
MTRLKLQIHILLGFNLQSKCHFSLFGLHLLFLPLGPHERIPDKTPEMLETRDNADQDSMSTVFATLLLTVQQTALL